METLQTTHEGSRNIIRSQRVRDQNWLDVCSLSDVACSLYTIVLSQHHTHEQDDPERTALSTQPLTAHTGNLRYSGEVHVRFFVARVGRRMPDHTWHCTSTCSLGQPLGRRARNRASGTLSAPGAPTPPSRPQHGRASCCGRWAGAGQASQDGGGKRLQTEWHTRRRVSSPPLHARRS